MNNSGRHLIFNRLSIILTILLIGGCAQTQVTNNSGTLLDRVKVGKVEFSENLDYCADGCSTGFKKVRTGDHKIALRETASSPWQNAGIVGPFKRGKFYSVNIRKQSSPFGRPPLEHYCVELWQRFDTAPEFNNDSTRTLVVSLCREPSTAPDDGRGSGPSEPGDFEPGSMVTNSTGFPVVMVKIDNDLEDDDEALEYTENIDSCSYGVCSTGYKTVTEGYNYILLKVTDETEWMTLSEPLGPFEYGALYSVNITMSGAGYCAELWKIANTDVPFPDDPDKVEIDSACF